MTVRLALIGMAAALGACSGPGSDQAASPAEAGFEDRPADIPDTMQIDTPQPNAQITTPLTLSGSVPGPWYFEGSFPIELRSEPGEVLAEGIAQATGTWMTSEPAGFEATLDFAVDEPTQATLVLSEQDARGSNDVRTARLPVILMPPNAGN